LLLKFDGKYYWQGDLVNTDDSRICTTIRRKIGRVFQQPFIFRGSVRENIELPLLLRKETSIKAIVERYAEFFNITHLLERNAKKLSGGESARVALARAFSIEPVVMLLDEPFSAIDFTERKDIIAKTKNFLRENRITTVIVTHNLEEAKEFADSVFILENGELKPNFNQ